MHFIDWDAFISIDAMSWFWWRHFSYNSNIYQLSLLTVIFLIPSSRYINALLFSIYYLSFDMHLPTRAENCVFPSVETLSLANLMMLLMVHGGKPGFGAVDSIAFYIHICICSFSDLIPLSRIKFLCFHCQYHIWSLYIQWIVYSH